VRAAQQFAEIAREFGPDDATTSQVALAWIARQPGVSTVIPGARSVDQATANAAAGSIELADGIDDAVRELYDRDFRAAIHPRW
jgi:aryl-alcohol dehydrogenase-like predicted oxidoreductase